MSSIFCEHLPYVVLIGGASRGAVSDVSGSLQALVENLESLPQQFTLGASLAVDTFFFLSGLLTTFTLLKRMRKSSKTSFPAGKFILLRFLRLTPLYAYILFFYT